MDEYTPKRFDIAQLNYLCESLFTTCSSMIQPNKSFQVLDPTIKASLELHDLIEHIANFTVNYRLKYQDEDNLVEFVEKYLDDSFILFSNYSISTQDFERWITSYQRVSEIFLTKQTCQWANTPLIH